MKQVDIYTPYDSPYTGYMWNETRATDGVDISDTTGFVLKTDYDARVCALQQSVDYLRKNIKEEKARVTIAQGTIYELERIIEDLDQHADEADACNDPLLSQRDTLARENQELKHKLEHLATDARGLINELKEPGVIINCTMSPEGVRSAYLQALESLRLAIEESGIDAPPLEMTRVEIVDVLQKTREQVAELSIKYTAKCDELNEAKRQLDQYEQRIRNKRDTIRDLEKTLDKLEFRIDEQEAWTEYLFASRSEQAEKVKELKSRLAEVNKISSEPKGSCNH